MAVMIENWEDGFVFTRLVYVTWSWNPCRIALRLRYFNKPFASVCRDVSWCVSDDEKYREHP